MADLPWYIWVLLGFFFTTTLLFGSCIYLLAKVIVDTIEGIAHGR